MLGRIDLRLLVPIVCLSLLSLLVLKSIAPSQFSSQAIFFIVSLVTFIVVSLIDFRIFFSLHLVTYICSLIFLVTPFFFSTHTRGSLRWLHFSQFSLQPSELIKPFLLVSFASISVLSKRKYQLLIGSFSLPAFIVFIQPDLGSTLVYLVGWGVIFISRIPLRPLIIFVAISLLLLPLSWFVLQPYQRQRLLTFVNPYRDPLGSGYHVIQSTTAVGSGQLFGRGLGHGTQSQLRFLPEHSTDFVFASLTEELGFTGGILVLLLYFLLLKHIYKISQTTPFAAASNYCLAVLSTLTFQVFVNIGMNMGIAPVTGITLPFVSYGGSSLISLSLILGLVSSISVHSHTHAALQIH